ncbi:hypothetical protein PAXINDRAFT_21985 [Paxillus involutus ATCC 200175]|uniref:Uncharacterized protein n=1 Tax=Paxillus involutus ATCC 200175 TaxID=664439 RepID=A0A0C9T912_PAXIN|nr:hypothetical protein PAXINDRAFT_21985 [Paxillus involutus ATCC 200175]
MITDAQLTTLCSERRLEPSFTRPPSEPYRIVSLTVPPTNIDATTRADLKHWQDVPDYVDPSRPWRCYIPRVSKEVAPQFVWLLTRLAYNAPRDFLTKAKPFEMNKTYAMQVGLGLGFRV